MWYIVGSPRNQQELVWLFFHLECHSVRVVVVRDMDIILDQLCPLLIESIKTESISINQSKPTGRHSTSKRPSTPQKL